MAKPRFNEDSQQYTLLARNLREHGAFSLHQSAPFTPTTRRAPLYPLFLLVFGDAARAVQAVIDSLTAAMICALAARRVRMRWAMAAGLLYAVQPGSVHYTNAVLMETLLAFLLAATVALLVRDGWGWAVAGGVTLGMAALCRPNVAPFVAVAAVLLWRAARRREAIVFCAAVVVTIAPWIVRSSVLAGQFVPVQAGGYLNLGLATKQGPWDLNDQSSFFHNPAYTRDDVCGRLNCDWLMSPRQIAEADARCRADALQNLRRNPGYYLRNRASQLIHFPLTSFDFVTGNELSFGVALTQRQFGVLATKIVLYVIFSLVPMLLAIAGIVFGPPSIEKRLAAALWIFVIVIFSPGFVEYRYFITAVPMLLVTAAMGLDWLTTRCGSRVGEPMPALTPSR